MTRDELRTACIKAMAIAAYGDDAQWARIPDHWREMEIAKFTRAFDALHGIACVGPVEATEEMKMHARISSNTSPENLWRVMSTAGDLTNPPGEAT